MIANPRRRTVATLAAERERQFDGVVDLAKLFSHDVVGAEDYRERTRHDGLPAGERALRLAMLQDALELLAKYADFARRDLPEHRETRWRREYIEARRWIATTGSRHVFSFEAVCEALGLEPDGIRRCVLRDAPRITPWTEPMQSAPRQEQPQRQAGAPPSQAARAWAWAQRQAEPWTVFELADGVSCPMSSARGYAADWKRVGLAERVGVIGVGRARIGRYRVVGRVREVG